MRLVLERLPSATIVSVAHRVELEAFHTRKLVLEYDDEGARLVRDEVLPPTITAEPSTSREHVRPMRRPRPAHDSVSAGLAPSTAHPVVEELCEPTKPTLAPNAVPALAPTA